MVRSLLVIASLIALAGLAATVSGGAPRKAPPPLATLLARHAPIVVLHPSERFRPVPVDGFLADSDLQRKVDTVWTKVDGPLPAGGADQRLDQRSCNASEGTAASPCYQAAEAAHGAPSAVYGAPFRTGRGIELQYWLWYPYNDYSPAVPPADLWQVHEGDWEAVSVVLDSAGTPLLAAYSQHGKGKRREWARVTKRGLRPVVFVALGSHANYFEPGDHRLDPRLIDPNFIQVITAFGQTPADHAASGPTLRPRVIPVTATTPAWMTFAGTWGEDGYVRFPNNQPPLVSGTGPRGPAFHAQWRSPVREALSWPRG